MAEGKSVSRYTDEKGIRVSVMVGGKRIQRRLPRSASASDAKQLEADIRSALGKRKADIPGDPLLDSVMDLYLEHAKTLRSPETAFFHARRAGPWCIGKRASDASIVMAKMVSDMTGHYAPATINRSLGAVKKALTLAYRSGKTPVDYGDKITRLPENNQRHTYLSVDQVKKIADNASEQVRAAIWIALLTGCRRGEILKIQAEDVGKNQIRIRQGNTKTLKERACPVVPAIRPWLAYIPIKINAEGLKTGFRRAREAAGMPDVNFHDLRHSCASILINLGVQLEVIRDILGHSSIKTTERYSHLETSHQAEALKKLSAIVCSTDLLHQNKNASKKSASA